MSPFGSTRWSVVAAGSVREGIRAAWATEAGAAGGGADGSLGFGGSRSIGERLKTAREYPSGPPDAATACGAPAGRRERRDGRGGGPLVARLARMEPRSARTTPYDDGRVGVYVHLPYCERICPYCDFAVLAARPLGPAIESRYVDDLLREWDARRQDFAGRELASLYFGGGTPSLFRPESIARLVAAVRAGLPASSTAASEPLEVTLEVNPSTLEADRLAAFGAAGIDRLSIGVQSFDDRQLKRLGRAHRAPVVRTTLEAARRAGFENVSLDLIFASPGQTAADLERDLAETLAWQPEHVSTYELTFEPATPFGKALAAGRLEACDEDRAADMIEQIERRLVAAGYERYEISSYARPGRRARHNARYWQRQAVLGLGMGAHSTEARSAAHPHGARVANPRTLEAWRAAIGSDPASAGLLERPTPAEARGEAVFLGLRQSEGVSAARFAAEFGAPPGAYFADEIARSRERGWLEEDQDGSFRLTAAGRLVADSVAAEFVADPSDRD